MTSAAPPPARIGREELVLHILGSGSGLPTAERDTSSLLIGAHEGWSLIDCPGSVVQKLAQRGLRPHQLRRLLLTHDHVDHVYGFPHLLQALAIAGGCDSLLVVAPKQTLDTVRAMVRTHGLEGDRYPRLDLDEIPLTEDAAIVAAEGLSIRTTPAAHGRDTASVRFETGSAAVCYSSDTRPSEAVERLARGADMLLHDCAGPHRRREEFGVSHSSAREAAQVAANAGVGGLVLMHLGARDRAELDECVEEAQATFAGTVIAAHDGGCWKLPAK